MQASVARRLFLPCAIAATAVGIACASPGMPPGGPPDTEVPELVRIVPDSNAVNVRAPAVLLQFDEVVNERSTGTGPATPGSTNSLTTVVTLSPSDGRDRVTWRRTALEIRPRGGFRPNTAYRVSIIPGLADIRGNRREEPIEFVFSTGPTLATSEIHGVLWDWTTGKAAIGALVEASRPSDSLFRWTARTDSLGRFRVRDLTPGEYRLRAWVDANNDRQISFREISDTAHVQLAERAELDLYAFVRDTLPPRFETVEMVDSTAIRVRFDRGMLDWDGRGVTLQREDSSHIEVTQAFVPAARFDSLRREARAAADSAEQAAGDTTVLAAGDSQPAGRPAALAPAAAATDTAAADTTAADTAATDTVPRPVFGRSVPEMSWVLPLDTPLSPGAYRLRVTGATGLNGRSADTDREIRVRPPPPRPAADSTAADTSAARRDTTPRAPAAARPARPTP